MKLSLFSFFVLILLSFSHCGPSAEKALTLNYSTSVGQLYPEQPWRFSPEFVLDGKNSTVFCADSKQLDSGFALFLEKNAEFSAIQITNGFAKSSSDATQNAQAKKIKLTSLVMYSEEGKMKVKSQESVTVDLKKVSFTGSTPNEQFVELGQTLKGNVIRVEFSDFFPGSKSSDICISELRFGEVKKSKFEVYPISNEPKLKSLIAGYEEASRHYWAFRKLIKSNESGSINFYDGELVLPVYFKADNTFSFSEMYGGDPASGGFSPAIQGSYSILASGEYGIDLNLSYFDANGIERNDSWIFKRAVSNDEDFNTFKTKLGPQFSEVFDSKNNYLLFFKEKESNRSFYNYQIPIK
ncbi:NADase-type glycan-binding domain-containing protein [Leptospira idonii]|uniref:NAD glycohydrolase translocation F5/8 type C domain-containing protein n=1 Tax=Leptospira idonii TaxID=1193500 RepID=A0A4R9LYA9_9LEPT|nr:hypothetical protein [Leptospira idonii]TGN18435.1 hypothetical protein EHS15_13645 [Leptospira idonii]